ncbi:Uncharacterized protein T07_9728 [Trichinella nelsoni]|uniref:Integrase catalytic domain-containing protein n=1 Tax=Trichinella nelsoni TaxID=6336 RepID=A0A0V0RK54_9BILA|nr:Uncharacterized protein T07_9728 [Trichinella nelsoni]
MVDNWHSRQELRYRSSKQRLRWFKLCFDCNTRKTLIYGWRALLQHKMWGSGCTSWVRCSVVSAGTYILVPIDCFTKYAEAFPISNQETVTIVDKLVDAFICSFGIPETIHANQGSQFESALFHQVCQRSEMRQQNENDYLPHSVGNAATLRQENSDFGPASSKNNVHNILVQCVKHLRHSHASDVVYTSIQAFPIADIASLIALAKLKNTIGDLISPLTGGNGRGILGGNVGMPFGNSGRLLGGGNYYGPNSGGILENLGSRFLGGGGLMNGMEERPLVGMLNNLLGGRNQGLLGRNNFRNRNGFDTPKGYDYYD